jgi:hypothetical protein
MCRGSDVSVDWFLGIREWADLGHRSKLVTKDDLARTEKAPISANTASKTMTWSFLSDPFMTSNAVIASIAATGLFTIYSQSD